MVSSLKIPILLKLRKKTEIIETVESNYRVARRVYHQLYLDVSGLFADFMRLIGPVNLQDMGNNIKANGLGIKKIPDVNNAEGVL